MHAESGMACVKGYARDQQGRQGRQHRELRTARCFCVNLLLNMPALVTVLVPICGSMPARRSTSVIPPSDLAVTRKALRTHPAPWRPPRRSGTGGCCCPRAAARARPLHPLMPWAGAGSQHASTAGCPREQCHARRQCITSCHSVPLPTSPCRIAYITVGFRSAPGASPKTCTDTLVSVGK